MSMGKMIKKRREELGYTQEQLAEKMGYKSKSTINKIEAGINDITQSKIVAFAKALKTTPSYLMGWGDEENLPIKLNKKEKFQYDKFMEDAIYFFNDESVSDDDKRKLLDSLNSIFLDIILEKNKKK